VPVDQRREGGFVPTGNEPFKQLPIAEASNRADREKRPQVMIDAGVMRPGYASGSGSA
jgi:hypothetical protein